MARRAPAGASQGRRPELTPGQRRRRRRLDRVKWKPPKVAEVVDRRVVVNPRQARELLTAVTYIGRPWRGRHLRAFFACMYFAALRPGEVKALRRDGCFLPASGWGRLILSRSRPQSNRRWTDSGEAFDDRGLKHRAEEDTRPVAVRACD